MTEQELIQYLIDNGVDYYVAEVFVENGHVTDQASADSILSEPLFGG